MFSKNSSDTTPVLLAPTTDSLYPKLRRRRDLKQASLVSSLTSLVTPEKTLTQQHMAEDCDINTIISNFNKTGQLTSENRGIPKFGDFSDVADFQSNLQRVLDAEAMFMDLPANIRKKFSNDPAEYIDFVLDPANLDESIKLGLVLPVSAEPVPPLPSNGKNGGVFGW